MHELTLCKNALDLAEQHARQNGAQRVVALWIEVGALSNVDEHALRFCFDIVCQDSLSKGCQLYLNTRAALALCQTCHQTSLLTHHGECCHQCGSHQLQLKEGANLRITQISVE